MKTNGSGTWKVPKYLVEESQGDEDPRTRRWKHLVVGEVDPLLDKGSILRSVAATKFVVGHVVSDGVTLEQAEPRVVLVGRDLIGPKRTKV